MKRFITILLAAMLLLSCAGCITLNGCTLSCSAPIHYSNADKYTAGNFTYDASAVKRVEIEWISGGITLKNGTGTLTVSESGADTLSEEQQMHWWLDGTTLKIRFCKSGYKYNLSKAFNEKKELTIELPELVDLDIDVASGKVQAESTLDLGTFTLDTASGGTDIRDLSAKEIKVDSASGGAAFGKVSVTGDFTVNSASGGLTVDEITANKVDVDSASGGITLLRVDADSLKIGSASGSTTVGVGTIRKMKLDSTSGSIRLTLLDKEAGAVVKFSAVSGNFNTSLSVVNSGDLMTFGSGYTDMEISIVSGSVTLD